LLADAQAQQGVPTFVGRQPLRVSENPPLFSASRQFVIQRGPRTGWLPGLGTNANVMRLDPTLLAISCDKIKTALRTELAIPQDQWRGRIELALHPVVSLDETVQLNSIRFADGWSYRVELPDAIERSRLITIVIEVLLREMGNRTADQSSVEIPAWLAQGLSQELQLDSLMSLVFEPPSRTENGVNYTRFDELVKKEPPLAPVNARLSAQPPLTLEELSWAQHDRFAGEAGQIYRDSAQLLVCALERLPDGRACLRAFLDELPRHLNWQIAFLTAFRGHFANQLAFDKWWELTLVQFTGQDMSQTWSYDESWRKLAEVVRPQAQVRMAANEIPLRTAVSLQAVIREWDAIRQDQVLGDKIRQLLILRVHVSRDLTARSDPPDPENRGRMQPGPRDLLPLVDAYREVLENFLKDRDKTGSGRLVNGYALPRARLAQEESVRELDALDARLGELRPPMEPEPETKNDPSAMTSNH
jgi:hypothetical protein